MAKNRSGKGRRDAPDIASSLPSPTVTPSIVSGTPVADRRTYHPEQAARPALSFGSTVATIKAKEVRYRVPQKAKRFTARPGRVAKQARPVRKVIKGRSQTRARLAFAIPSTVPVCVRRHMRREVLHALRKTGRGVRRKKPRLTWLSKIRC